MSGDILSTLRDLASRDLSDEETARALLDLTLQAAPPEVADAVRVCALPAWFDAEILVLLTEPVSPPNEEPEGEQSLPPVGREAEEGSLLERMAAFSFVMPRERGGYVYHEATRERLLDWWRKPENRPRFAVLVDRLARFYLALAEEQVPRLSGPAYLEALAVLDESYPNIRAAWEGAGEAGNEKLVRNFAYALPDYFRHRNLWSDWIAWTQAGLEACKHMGDEAGAAGMQNNLGNAYANLPTGERGANLGRAIECYEQALTVYTAEAAPLDYAGTQNNLGAAYAALPTGDRGVNLGRAIECYQQALRFRTPETAPFQYATTQNNLGNAYRNLPTGDRAANLRQAIECYQKALTVYTPEAAPRNYAMVLNNMGLVYLHLPTGGRVTNLKEALQYAEAALQFEGWSPWERAECLSNRGLIHLALGHLDQALADYQAAIPLATAITIAEALQELDKFAAGHPDTPGLDTVRALLRK